jgi:hypothetical protein
MSGAVPLLLHTSSRNSGPALSTAVEGTVHCSDNFVFLSFSLQFYFSLLLLLLLLLLLHLLCFIVSLPSKLTQEAAVLYSGVLRFESRLRYLLS